MTVTQVTVPEDQGHGPGPGLMLKKTSRQMTSHCQEDLQEEGMSQDRKQKSQGVPTLVLFHQAS